MKKYLSDLKGKEVDLFQMRIWQEIMDLELILLVLDLICFLECSNSILIIGAIIMINNNIEEIIIIRDIRIIRDTIILINKNK